MDETNAALWGRKLRAKLDAFLESRGLSHEPISDSYIATSSGDESDGPVEMLGG